MVLLLLLRPSERDEIDFEIQYQLYYKKEASYEGTRVIVDSKPMRLISRYVIQMNMQIILTCYDRCKCPC